MLCWWWFDTSFLLSPGALLLRLVPLLGVLLLLRISDSLRSSTTRPVLAFGNIAPSRPRWTTRKPTTKSYQEQSMNYDTGFGQKGSSALSENTWSSLDNNNEGALEHNNDNNDDTTMSNLPIDKNSNSSMLNRESSTVKPEPRFKLGLLTDIQYAPIPDGFSYGGTPRYYRHALEVAQYAASHFQEEQVNMMINLGDIVDGKCQNIYEHGGGGGGTIEDGNTSNNDDDPSNMVDPGHQSVDQVLKALSVYQQGPVLHVYGNHCLYNLNREELQMKLGIPFVQESCGDLVGYSIHTIPNQLDFRIIVLDSYDIATMRRCSMTSEKYKLATEVLRTKNPNYHDNENSPEGLIGEERRFVAFNGAIGPKQLLWLQSTLQQCRQDGVKVLVLSHQPVLPGSTSPVCLIWNYQDVLDILRQYNDIIVASLSGHAHQGGYLRDEMSGIHFRVVEAVLENPHPHKTYAILDMYDNYLHVRGFGNCQSAIYDFNHCKQNNVPVKQR